MTDTSLHDGRVAVPAVAHPALKLPPEPVELRDRLQEAVLAGEPWQPSAGGGSGLAGALWRRWRAPLTAAGLDRAAFDATVDGYRRELWLWILGDRRWEPTVEHLAGRLQRRLPPPA